MNAGKSAINAGLIILSAAVSSLSAAPATQIDFKVTPQLGKVTRLQMVTKTVGSVKMPDPFPEQKFSQLIEQEYLSKCIKIDPDGSALYEMSTPKISMETNYGGFKSKSRYDSSEAPAQANASKPSPSTQPRISDAIFKIFSAMTQAKFTLTVNREGKPLKVQGYTESMNKALRNVGDLRPEEKPMINGLRQTLTNEFMMEQMKYRYRLYPPHPRIQVGETWTSTDEMNMAMFHLTAKYTTEYKLVNIEEFHGRPCMKLQFRETIQIAPKPKPKSNPAAAQPQNPLDAMDFKFKTNEGNGVAYVDYQTGDVVQFHKTQRVVSDVTMPQPAPSQNTGPAKPFHTQQSAVISFSMDIVDPTTSVK